MIFEESRVDPKLVQVPIQEDYDNNVAVPGEDRSKVVVDNIGLSPESSQETDTTDNGDSENYFEDAQDSQQEPLRRSSRIRKQTGE